MVHKYYVNISGGYIGDIKDLFTSVNNLKLKNVKLIFTETSDDYKSNCYSDLTRFIE